MTKPNSTQLKHSREVLKKQPYLKELRKQLISYGGNLVCDWNNTNETEVIMLKKMGMLWSTKGIKNWKKETNHCHDNSELIEKNNPKRYKWITGFALSEGLWIPHSWLWDMKNGNILETTFIQQKYFGYPYPRKDNV